MQSQLWRAWWQLKGNKIRRPLVREGLALREKRRAEADGERLRLAFFTQLEVWNRQLGILEQQIEQPLDLCFMWNYLNLDLTSQIAFLLELLKEQIQQLSYSQAS